MPNFKDFGMINLQCEKEFGKKILNKATNDKHQLELSSQLY